MTKMRVLSACQWLSRWTISSILECARRAVKSTWKLVNYCGGIQGIAINWLTRFHWLPSNQWDSQPLFPKQVSNRLLLRALTDGTNPNVFTGCPIPIRLIIWFRTKEIIVVWTVAVLPTLDIIRNTYRVYHTSLTAHSVLYLHIDVLLTLWESKSTNATHIIQDLRISHQ